jgi:hypothetical protein
MAVAEAVCQNDAKDMLGGEVLMCAGTETDTDVSDISVVATCAAIPNHSTLQVALAPCEAGGVHMASSLIRTDPNMDVHVEFVTVHIVPAAHIREVGVKVVAVPDVDVNLNLCLTKTLLLICGGREISGDLFWRARRSPRLKFRFWDILQYVEPITSQ